MPVKWEYTTQPSW